MLYIIGSLVYVQNLVTVCSFSSKLQLIFSGPKFADQSIAVCAQNVRLQHERKHVDAAPLAYSTFNNRVTQSGPLALMCLFSSSTSEIDYDRLAPDQC